MNCLSQSGLIVMVWTFFLLWDYPNLLTAHFILPWDHAVPNRACTPDSKAENSTHYQPAQTSSGFLFTHSLNFLYVFWGCFPQPCFPLLLQGLFGSIDAKSIQILLCIMFFAKKEHLPSDLCSRPSTRVTLSVTFKCTWKTFLCPIWSCRTGFSPACWSCSCL